MSGAKMNGKGKHVEHVLSLSYGKDSLACLGAIEELGWPLDRIAHAEVWATDTIPADLPSMMEFKAYADEIILSRWGIRVEHVRAKKTYEQQFYTIYQKGSRSGTIYGWPTLKGPWCNSELKTAELDKICRNGVNYWGIAADEPERIEKHKKKRNVKMPLVAAGWTEADCRKWCGDNGLLSPIYTTATRGGCWFCHNQSVGQLRLLRENYPEYWSLMLKWDKDSIRLFDAHGHTVHDFDQRFRMEDDGLISPNKAFRWSALDEEPACRIEGFS